jgi:bifunctional hydroxylase/dehydrase
VNLGWKLAAAVHGWAPPGLLASYHDERHPVGARVLMNTSAQGLLYLSGDETDPLRELFGELMRHEEVGRTLAGMVSGLDVRYDVGPGDHPLLGRRLPPIELLAGNDKTDTFALLHGGRGVLLDLEDDPGRRRSLAPWADRVDAVQAAPHDGAAGARAGLDGTAAVLVRPDGHVAWAAPGHGDTLTGALEHWFGAPREVA